MLRQMRRENIYVGGFWKYKLLAAALYLDFRCQVFVAILIASNFLFNIVEKQVDPDGSAYPVLWENAELFFNIIFALELSLNLYGFWCWPFWSSGWNVFDFVVVSVGVLDICRVPMTGPLVLLRTLRAFRVFRLFKRVKELQKIVVSLVRAVPGVLNVFLIMAIVMSIYSLLAVEFYRDVGIDAGIEGGDQGNVCITKFITARGNCYGEEYFGNFMKAAYTLFQILTGDSWSEAVVRLVVLEHGSTGSGIMSTVFFVSYICVTAIILINVVVAVLLDKMSSLDDPDDVQGGTQEVQGGCKDTDADAVTGEENTAPEEQCSQRARQDHLRPSNCPERFSEIDSAFVQRAEQDAENEEAQFSMLSAMPTPMAPSLPPPADLLAVARPEPISARGESLLTALEIGEVGSAEQRRSTARPPPGSIGGCASARDVAKLRQEVADVRCQMEAVSSRLQEVLALVGGFSATRT